MLRTLLFVTVLELLAFLVGHVTLAMPLFEKFLRAHVWANRESKTKHACQI